MSADMYEKERVRQDRASWHAFTHSPLTMFAGIFALFETVVLAFLSMKNDPPLDPIDALVVILLTVTLFVLIVLARPQALYPPNEWREPSHAPEARIAIVFLLGFVFMIGGGWMMKYAGPGWAKVIHGEQSRMEASSSSETQKP